jgi:hypothetical protein
MENRDLYVCPLCYTVVYNRMVGAGEGTSTEQCD